MAAVLEPEKTELGWPLTENTEAPGGTRYAVNNRLLHAGDPLEIKLKGPGGSEVWIPCAFELSRGKPVFYLQIAYKPRFLLIKVEAEVEEPGGWGIYDRLKERRVWADLEEDDGHMPYQEIGGGPVWRRRGAAEQALKLLERLFQFGRAMLQVEFPLAPDLQLRWRVSDPSAAQSCPWPL